MGSTVKISRSKNLSFKKLSFLYLVFILFLFFSSPGQYVYQYKGIAATQSELNSRLTAELTGLRLRNAKEYELKKTTLESCLQMDLLLKEYLTYAAEHHITGDKLRENNFVTSMNRSGKLAPKIDAIILHYTTSYSRATKKDLYTELIQPVDFKNKQFLNIEFYFKDTPNGVIPSVFELYKTIFLYQTLLVFKKEVKPEKKVEILTLNGSDFIQRFKKNIILGENLDILIKTDDSTVIPKVKINGSLVNTKDDNNGKSHLHYSPKKPGNYSIDVSLGAKRVLTSFTVEAPSFHVMHGELNVKGEVGKPIILPYSDYRIPANNHLTFISNAAEIRKMHNVLNVIPKKEGKFEIQMLEGEKVLDKLSIFATIPSNPVVALMDITGQPVEFENAHRLESVNTYWQVINFDMILVEADGNQNQFHCATRFLRNELRQAEANAPAGSTLIFNNIKLIGRDGKATALASPLVILK